MLPPVFVSHSAQRPRTPAAIYDMREAVERFAEADRMRRDAEQLSNEMKVGALELLSQALPPVADAAPEIPSPSPWQAPMPRGDVGRRRHSVAGSPSTTAYGRRSAPHYSSRRVGEAVTWSPADFAEVSVSDDDDDAPEQIHEPAAAHCLSSAAAAAAAVAARPGEKLDRVGQSVAAAAQNAGSTANGKLAVATRVLLRVVTHTTQAHHSRACVCSTTLLS